MTLELSEEEAEVVIDALETLQAVLAVQARHSEVRTEHLTRTASVCDAVLAKLR